MSNGINDEIIGKIHDNGDLVSLVSEYLTLKKTGSNHMGLCPFHNEKTPSFSVSGQKQFYKCFGCGEGGDIISFVMKMENLSFVEAVKFLAEKYGIPLAETRKVDKKLLSLKEEIYEINKETARYYYRNLVNHESSLKYLKNRNIGRGVLNQFGLGYSIDSWDNVHGYLKDKGYKDEDIEKAGIIGKRKDGRGYFDKFRNRIMFPIIDPRGRIIGFGGRVMDDSMPKYLNSQDTPVFDKGNNLYGLNLIKKHSNREKIILVEGYMDVIALFNNGIKYSVASLGTAFTPRQGKLLKRYGREIFICYDSDTAGLNATLKVLKILKKEGVKPKVIKLPSGQDPDDFINENGVKEFEKLLDEALNYIEYNIYLNKKKYDLSISEDNIQFTKEIAKVLKELKSPIETDVYIDEVSKATGISKEAIEREISGGSSRKNRSFQRKPRYRKSRSGITPGKNILEPAYLTTEKTLLKLMIEDRAYYNLVQEKLDGEEFLNYESQTLEKIIRKIYEQDDEKSNIDSNIVLEKVKEIDDIDILMVKDMIDRNIDFLPENKTELIEDLLETFRYSKLQTKREEIKKEIQKLEKDENKVDEDFVKLNSLCFELIEINNQL